MTSTRPILYHAARTESTGILWLIHEIEETSLKNYFIIKTLNLQNGENKKPDYLKLNPHGTVPTFISEEGIIMTEFSAIIMVLSTKYASYHDMHPSSLENFYQWMVYSNSFHETIMRVVREMVFNSNENPTLSEENIEKLKIRLNFIQNHLKGKEFMCDEKFTTVDIAIGFNLFWVNQMGHLKSFEGLTKYINQLKLRKSFISTFKKEATL
jgi:glutathione S-transferase